ncbi:ABC transporter substrate-binding protein [Vibrio sp. SCSIO 43136]|uniref:ABC transporter substrate-binding protein n=1 Tax=Vibrio sp. SCSIO 43136 TaxID=2819101 RepID=UPI002075C0E6|nr:ABC transporter substrate-binding protein [Vibrio sp. SCSIO 43136]
MLVLSCVSSGGLAQEKFDQKDPYQMMQQVAEKTFNRLKNERDQIREQPELLKVVVEEELMPYVNYRYAALKLLGSNFNKDNKDEVLVFIDAFRNYLVTSYAQVLTQFDDQEIIFERAQSIPEGKRITEITVEIVDKPNPNIKLDFKLRKDKKSGDWAAFDMVAEGISLLSSKRSEWNTSIRQKGITAVANELQAQSEQPIVFKQ